MKNKNKLIVLGGTQCPACKQLNKYLEQEGVNYEYYSIDTLEGELLANKYSVMSLPTSLLLSEEEKLIRLVSGFNIKEIKELLTLHYQNV